MIWYDTIWPRHIKHSKMRSITRLGRRASRFAQMQLSAFDRWASRSWRLAQHWHIAASLRVSLRRGSCSWVSLPLLCRTFSVIPEGWADSPGFGARFWTLTLCTIFAHFDKMIRWYEALLQALVCYGMGRLFLTRCPLLRQATSQTWCRALIIDHHSLIIWSHEKDWSKHVKPLSHVKFPRECHVSHVSHVSHLRHATGSFWAGGGCCHGAQDVAAAAIHVAGAWDSTLAVEKPLCFYCFYLCYLVFHCLSTFVLFGFQVFADSLSLRWCSTEVWSFA